MKPAGLAGLKWRLPSARTRALHAFCVVAAAGGMLLSTVAAQAQAQAQVQAQVQAQAAAAYPARPVRIVAGFPAGGPVDTLARALAEKLTQSMGQTFIVDNIAGATGMIGTERVAKAAADGYTLLVGASTIPIHASLIKALPYDTVRELIAWVKANPGKHSYGSAGTSSGLVWTVRPRQPAAGDCRASESGSEQGAGPA